MLAEVPLHEAREWARERAKTAPDDAIALHLASHDALIVASAALKRMARRTETHTTRDLFGNTETVKRDAPNAFLAAKELGRLSLEMRKVALSTASIGNPPAKKTGAGGGFSLDFEMRGSVKGPWESLGDASQSAAPAIKETSGGSLWSEEEQADGRAAEETEADATRVDPVSAPLPMVEVGAEEAGPGESASPGPGDALRDV